MSYKYTRQRWTPETWIKEVLDFGPEEESSSSNEWDQRIQKILKQLAEINTRIDRLKDSTD